MNTLKWYRISLALICLTMVLALTIANVKAGPTLQGETEFAAIDAYITEQMDDLGVPGMALGIVEDGQIVHLQGFGTADSSGRAVTPQTPFYIGSLTKSFTALAVMQLVEAGKIDLDAPVQQYLPWFELADKQASAKITVRNLLNHASGISEKDGNRFWASEKGLEDFVRDLKIIRLDHPVGTAYEYSNINFGIAGLIVEQVSGHSYTDYVSQNIFEPLDMRHSYLSHESALADELSDGHHYIAGQPFAVNKAMPPAGVPSGGLIASVEDMSHYVIAQLNEGQFAETSVLSPQGIKELHAPGVPRTPLPHHYAMGWNTGTVDGKLLIWHGGDVGNFSASVFLIPDSKSGLILLSNATGYEQMGLVGGQLPIGLVSLMDNEPPAPLSSLPFPERFLYWAILLTPLLQIIGIVLGWLNRQRIKLWGFLLTIILNLGAILLLFGLSQLIPFQLPSMLVFFPELGFSLIAIAVLGIGWSVIYTSMYVRQRRAMQGLAVD